jgi:hypothetical protein
VCCNVSKRRSLLASSCLSASSSFRIEQLGSHWTDFSEIRYLNFFENLSRKFKFYYNLKRIAGILHDVQRTFLIISRSFLLTIRNVSNKYCRENQNTLFMFNDFFFENRAVYEIIWKNMTQPGRPQGAIWPIRISC